MYSPTLRKLYELEILDRAILFDFGEYRIIYLYENDRLIIQLSGLGVFEEVYDTSSYLDIECIVSNTVLDILEKLLNESIVIYEEEV